METKVNVFLGGTCNGSKWRDELKPMLNCTYFDPVVPDWNEEAYQRELHARATADKVLYTITPEMDGYYSIAEVIDDSNKRPQKTVLCVLDEYGGKSFDEHQKKSLRKIEAMVKENGGKVTHSLDEITKYLNQELSKEKILAALAEELVNIKLSTKFLLTDKQVDDLLEQKNFLIQENGLNREDAAELIDVAAECKNKCNYINFVYKENGYACDADYDNLIYNTCQPYEEKKEEIFALYENKTLTDEIQRAAKAAGVININRNEPVKEQSIEQDGDEIE